MTVNALFDRWRPSVEAALDRLSPVPDTPPTRLHEAMRYSLFAGGKRLRPILVALAFEAAGGRGAAWEAPASAVEMVHTYSLIHDDLPAMDDDDLRRGKPTCHRVFGDAMAILAGDALLTRAFEVLSVEVQDAGVARRLVAELAGAAGAAGMVGGQVLDLGSSAANADRRMTETIAGKKTAALIRASLRMGAIAARGTPQVIENLGAYGERVGLAFQVIDDILDRLATAEELGKTPGKDLKDAKLTFPAVLGIEGARDQASIWIEEAKSRVRDLDGAGPLLALADFIRDRRS